MALRLAVLGCGAVARRFHLPGLRHAGAEVSCFSSRTRASAEAAAAEWGSGEVVDDWLSVLTRDDVDAVDICAPNALHMEMAVAAAEAGKHVLVEKPMARSVAEVDAMIDAARGAGVVLMPAHNLRFAKPFVAARRLVAAGRIGGVVGVRAAFGHQGPAAWAPDSSWFFDPSIAGGGALLDLGVHAADLLRFVLGDDVTEVAGMLLGGPSGTEQAAQLLLRFGGGAIGSLHASWAARPGPDQQLTIFGTEGTLHVDARMPLTLRAADGSEPERVDLPDTVPDLYSGFMAAATTGTEPPVTAEDGRAALAIIEAGYRSAEAGTIVTVEP